MTCQLEDSSCLTCQLKDSSCSAQQPVDLGHLVCRLSDSSSVSWCSFDSSCMASCTDQELSDRGRSASGCSLAFCLAHSQLMACIPRCSSLDPFTSRESRGWSSSDREASPSFCSSLRTSFRSSTLSRDEGRRSSDEERSSSPSVQDDHELQEDHDALENQQDQEEQQRTNLCKVVEWL